MRQAKDWKKAVKWLVFSQIRMPEEKTRGTVAQAVWRCCDALGLQDLSSAITDGIFRWPVRLRHFHRLVMEVAGVSFKRIHLFPKVMKAPASLPPLYGSRVDD